MLVMKTRNATESLETELNQKEEQKLNEWRTVKDELKSEITNRGKWVHFTSITDVCHSECIKIVIFIKVCEMFEKRQE